MLHTALSAHKEHPVRQLHSLWDAGRARGIAQDKYVVDLRLVQRDAFVGCGNQVIISDNADVVLIC